MNSTNLRLLLSSFGFLAAAIAYPMISGCESNKEITPLPCACPSEQPKPISALEECGYGGSDCKRFNLDAVKTKGKSEAVSLGDEKALNCTGKRASRNEDGTWNVCACTCVPASQIAKPAPMVVDDKDKKSPPP